MKHYFVTALLDKSMLSINKLNGVILINFVLGIPETNN
jgi:hypothetical protein